MITFTLGERLDELGITKNKFAVTCKVRPSSVADYVNNKVERPELSTLNKFVNGLTLITIQRGVNIKHYTLNDIMQFEFVQDEIDLLMQNQNNK